VKSVRTYLKVVVKNGIPVSRAVVYGSQAKGTADKWSDIDLIVISPRFDKERTRKDLLLLWDLTANTDSRIEPYPAGEKQWEEEDSSARIEIARREGIEITLAEG